MRGKKILLTSVILFTFLLLIGKISAFSFIVSPPKVEVTSRSPGKTTFNLQVINTEKRGQNFKVYLTDLRLTEEGKLEFPPAGEGRRSCAGWIEVKPSKFFLQSFETEDILCNIDVQEGQEGEFYATIMVESQGETEGKEEKLGFKVFSRIAIPVFILIKEKKITRKISILSIKVDRSPKNVLQFTVPIKNMGNVHLKVTAEATIRDILGRRWLEFPLEAGGGTILPESTRYFKAGNVEENLLFSQGFLEISAICKAPYTDKTIETKVIFPFDLKNLLGSSIYLYPLPFAINPPLIDMSTFSGGRKSIFLEIDSVGNTNPLCLKANLKDIKINEEGKPYLLDLKDSPSSAPYRVEIAPDEFVVLSGEKRRLRLNLNIQGKLKGSYYGRVVFHSVGAEKIPIFYGITLFSTISNKLSRKCRLLSLKLVDGSQPHLVFSIKNTGNTHLAVKGNINLEDERGNSLLTNACFDQGEFIFFPGEIVNLTALLPYKIPPGKYTVYLKIFSGEKQLLQKREKIALQQMQIEYKSKP